MKGRILVAGSRKGLLDTITKVYKKNKYEVDTAFSLKEALKKVKDFNPQAVIHAVDSHNQECMKLCERHPG